MFNISLHTLILCEVIFVLVVICAIILLISIKQKRLIREMQEQFNALRKRMHQILSEPGYIGTDTSSDPKHGDPVGIFLHNSTQYALERFKKFVPDGIPSLRPDVPFGAKIAALRYLYLMAEAENRTKQNTPENWLLLEKKLADIARWIRNIPKGQNHAGARIKQLHEQIDQLKRHSTENSHLKRQLTLAHQKNQMLNNDNKSHTDNIKKMQTLINTFQRSLPNSNIAPTLESNQDGNELSQTKRHENAYNAYQGSISQMDNIAQISHRKQELLTQLSESLNNSFPKTDNNDKNKFEEKIKTLEIEILGSDHHITTLQKELKTARENIAQLQEMDNHQESAVSMPISIIHNGDHQDPAPEKNAKSWINDGGHERTLEEIEHLRSNNQHQRLLILELNSEINKLRENINNTEDETLRKEKSHEIIKLERLVKECEFCIETLESEVDLLRGQIDGEYENELSHPDIEKLNKDIQQMSEKLHQTIAQYSHSTIINQFSIKLLERNNIESIAQLIVDTVKRLNVNFGFYLDSIVDKTEYHSDSKPSPQEQKILKLSDNDSAIGYINEGILFSQPHVRLIIKNPPEEDEEQAILETTLNTLAQLINSKINHLDSILKISTHDKKIVHSLKDIKSNIVNIKNLHNNQSNNAKSIITDLAKEMESSIKLLNPSPSIKSVFENAINESYKRMKILDTENDSIHQYANDIINAVETLQ